MKTADKCKTAENESDSDKELSACVLTVMWLRTSMKLWHELSTRDLWTSSYVTVIIKQRTLKKQFAAVLANQSQQTFI